MKRRVLGLSGLLVLLALGLGVWLRSGSDPSKPVTEAEARAYFQEIVAASLAQDFTRLCNLNGAVLNCQRALDDTAKATVPTSAPSTIAARFVGRGDSDESEGWLLTVTGSNGQGQPYNSEVFIFRDDENELKAINAVFWLGDRIGLDDPDGVVTPG